jgi:alpha-glucosidase
MYTETSLSGIAENQLIMTPTLIVGNEGKKLCIAESDVISYPGMFLTRTEDYSNVLSGTYASYPEKMAPRSWNDSFYKICESVVEL